MRPGTFSSVSYVFPAGNFRQQKTRLFRAGLSCPIKDLRLVTGAHNQRKLLLVSGFVERL
ncbi:hypothetical protein KBA01_21280 [Kozakia baliensis]|nr:hypothetical protein KBA01_21280 [Kozakia baliensis]